MNHSILAAQLRSVLEALRADLKPELTSPQAKLRAELIDMLLSRLAVEADTHADSHLHQSELASCLRPWIGQAAELPCGTEKAFSDELAAVDLADARQRGRVADLVASIAVRERDWRIGVESRLAETGSARTGASRSSAVPDIPVAPFSDYLRRRFPDQDGLSARKLTTVPGGRSKSTILVELEAQGEARSIVLRKDFDVSVTGTSVSYEYPILRTAWEHGLPVPQPLWLEEDPEVIGGRFIAFSRVPGKAMGTLFSSDATPAFVRQFAAGLARLHRLDIDGTGLAAKLTWGTSGNPVQAMLGRFRQRYRDNVPATPLMDAAFAWLDMQIDSIGNERALVHGDAGLHNAMGDGDRLTALLDWEFAHAGDPAEDLVYCKYLVERIVPWEEFMAVYCDHGGLPVSAERLRFFTVWRTLLLSILTGGAQTVFASGRDRDLRLAGIGYTTFPRQLRDLAADLAAVTT